MSNLVPATWRDTVEDLRQRVSNVFDQWLPRRSEHAPNKSDDLWSNVPLSAMFPAMLPAMNIADTVDAVTVTAELPGLDKQDFDVELDRQRLILRGEKKAERSRKADNYLFSERAYGSFFRAVPLPCEVQTDKVCAKYKHGVLTVTMPKTEKAKAGTVHVNVN